MKSSIREVIRMDAVGKLAEPVNIDEMKKKKEIKNILGNIGFGLFFSTLIEIIFSTIGFVLLVCVCYPNWLNMTDEETDALFSNLENQEVYGLLGCATVLVGIGFLFLYVAKRIDKKQMFSIHKKMNSKAFFQLLCVFLGVQLPAELIFLLMEEVFNFFGYSVMSSIEEATASSTTLFMLLYTIIVAPVVEELIYRGIVLVSIEKFGKVYAIMISALLFGLMHGNIPQSIFAFIVGIVLGYVAIEYSIWWAVLLHVLNNGLSELFYVLTKNLRVGLQNGIFYALFGVCFLVGTFCIWKKCGHIREYFIKNKPNKKTFLYTFTTVGILVFIIMETWIGISMIEKLG